jgi:TonB-linked SusC/RagA family outer membrane protein
MMRKLFFVVLSILAINTMPTIAQTTTPKVTIKGVILSAEDNKPLASASILFKGETKGISADSLGAFTFKVDKNKPVIFSYIGYEPQEMVFAKSQSIVVQLKPIATANDEVVVVGYGTQKRGNVTGAVAKYKNDRIDETSVPRLDQALQGRIAGVQVQNVNPEAGSDAKVSIRGVTSLSASNGPLVVVDGQPVPDGLAFVNMADVESVEVLKDAASAAIYGSRGSAGVIIITTKAGKAEKTKYALKYSIGFRNPYKKYNVMTVSDYARLLYQEAALRYTDSAAYTLGFTAAQLTSFSNNRGNLITGPERAAYIIENTITGPTNWQEEALRTGLNSNLQLNASGGSKTVKYFVSGGYQKDEGMMYNSNFERFSLRTKFDVQMSKRVKMSLNLNPTYTRRERPSTNFTDFYRFMSYLPVFHNEQTAAFVNQVPAWAHIRPGDYAQARHFNNIVYSGDMPDGSFWNNSSPITPFATSNNTPKTILDNRSINNHEYRLQGSVDLTVNIMPGLDFKSMASSFFNYTNGLDFAKRNWSADGVVNQGIYSDRNISSLYNENRLDYNKKIKKHTISAMAAINFEKTIIRDEKAVGLDYPTDNITTLNMAGTISRDSTYTRINREALISYLGRVNYSYDNKYLLTLSLRYDGSSRFAVGNKWGSFPAASLGWVATQEKFLNGKISWLNSLKFRLSHGLTGNNRFADYFGFTDILFNGNYSFGTGTGTAGIGLLTDPSTLANRNLTWERTAQTNFGIDLSVIKNRVQLTVDIYTSKTEALLLKQTAMAFTGAQFYNNNKGSLRNNGIEFELNTVNITKRDFRWTTTANLSRNRNNLIELGQEAFLLNQGERTELYLNQVGLPLIQFFGYRTDGVWLSQQQINDERAKGLTSPLSNVFIPGGLKLVDVNGDNIINEQDRTIIGNPFPDFTWGLTNNFTYKSFDLSFTFQGVKGGNLINGDVNYNESRRYIREYVNNRWISPNNPGDGKTPYSTVGFNWMLTDYAVEDASYFALREILLGYKFSNKIAKKIGLTGLRAYTSAQNLFFSFAKGYRGLNPEARSASGPYATPLIDGYQRGAFPTSRAFVIGLDINF